MKKLRCFLLRCYSVFPNSIKRLIMKLIHNIERYCAFEFEIHLTEHCNLNCKGCDNFSPLAQPKYIEIEEFKRDFERIAELFSRVRSIRLLGGEPLLHPDIKNIMVCARKVFPGTKIMIVTNGLRFPQMDDSFWNVCKENSIEIMMTKYPIKFDYLYWKDFLNQKGIKADFFSVETLKTLYKKPLDINGTQNQNKMFDLCLNANRCISLKEGKLYTCTTIPNVEHFNRAFQTNLEVSNLDYIDIYSDVTQKQIRKFLSKSVPFCKYCDVCNEQFGIPWSVSKKDMGEWV